MDELIACLRALLSEVNLADQINSVVGVWPIRRSLCLLVPETAQNCQDERHDKHGRDHENGEAIHQVLDVALLVPSVLRVHHNARLFASVDYEADDPVCVAQVSALEQHLLVVQ